MRASPQDETGIAPDQHRRTMARDSPDKKKIGVNRNRLDAELDNDVEREMYEIRHEPGIL